jgi:hypothetical protein
VQTWGGGIKTAVIGNGVAGKKLLELLGICGHMHETTPFQFIPEGIKTGVIGL